MTHASILRDIERAETTLARMLEISAELSDGSLREATDAAVMGLHAWIMDMTDRALDVRDSILAAA